MTRILHVCEVAKGGIGTYIDLIWAVRNPDDTHLVVAPQSHAHCITSHMDRVLYPDQGRGARTLGALVKATRQAIRDFDPDIVFLHSTFTMVMLPFLAMPGQRAKVIYCAHGWAQSRYQGGMKRWIVAQVEGKLPRLSHRVLSISEHDLQLARTERYAGAHVMIEGAALLPPNPSELVKQSDAIKLLFIGRFAKQKGLDLLLEALARVRETRKDIVLEIAGGQAEELGAAAPDGVTFLGWLDHAGVAERCAAADALVVPSRWEGFGMVVVEAMAQSTPALVSRRGALPDLVVEDRTGLTFDLTVEAMAACLSGLEKAKLRDMRPHCLAAYESRYHPSRFGMELASLFDAVQAKSPAQ